VSGYQLTLRSTPALRLDLRGVLPSTLAALSAAEVEKLPVQHGAVLAPLAEWFDVKALGGDSLLQIVGDAHRVDRIGWGMTEGRIEVDGDAGHYLGGTMTGGTLHVSGGTGDFAACEMAGGTLQVDGDIGDFGAGAQAGSMDGMRGGTFTIGGNAGARFGDRMRRGTAIIGGDAGDFLASRLVAGTIVLGGRTGVHPAYGMRRGTLLALAGAASGIRPSPTFVASPVETPVFWQLLARDLETFGGACAGLRKRRCERWLGDVAVDGRGEVLLVQ